VISGDARRAPYGLGCRLSSCPRPALKILASILLAALPAAAFEPRFDPAEIRAHVEFLADDLLEGREAGTRGYDLAARYVATRYAAMGLVPPVAGSWYQAVPLVRSRLQGTASLTIGERTFAHKDSMVTSASLVEPRQRYDGPVVFAGYCIAGPEKGDDDYAGLDVKGKLVACLSGFPKGMKSDVGAHLSSRKRLMAQERGALGIIGVQTRQSARVAPWSRMMESADEPASAWMQPDGTAYREAPRANIGATLHTTAAQALFAGAPRTLEEILDEADRPGGRPKGFNLVQRVSFSRDSELSRYTSPNVVALLPGSDPALSREVVVLMAHLDHLGPDPSRPKDPIRNGAIDNAAGVATLLEVARALVAAPAKPRRSILFAAVTAEESGLLGSQYLARHPVLADHRVVAVVNLDAPMLLYEFTDVIAFGEAHSTLGPVIARATGRAGVRSSPDPIPEQGVFTRSDHYSFVKEGVPAVFLVTGFANGGEKHFREYLSTHYHRPSDSLDLPIDWKAAAKFARINYEILRDIADEPQRPLWYSDSLFGNAFAAKEPKAQRR
jgi:Zn-dependent M28 family amino/carboxypeptidase